MYLANVMFDGRIEAVMKELLAELNEQERSDPLVNQYAGIFTANDSHEPDIYEFLFGDKEDAFQLARIEGNIMDTVHQETNHCFYRKVNSDKSKYSIN